jgi:S-adenosylmethionine synthetase
VGKIYNFMALETAQAIVDAIPEVRAATVYLLSQIGHPLDRPLVATAQVTPRNGALSGATEAAVGEILDAQLADVEALRAKILRLEISPF